MATDADCILPADGSSLLATLDRALEGLTSQDGPAARARIEAFVGRGQALLATGVLEPGDGQPPIEAAAALVAGLPSVIGTDG